MRGTARALAAATLVALSGCAVGPDYSRPNAPVSAAFKELAGWKPATPMDDIDRGAWWSVYGDPVLDRLERETEISNQNIRQAEAAYRQAAAEVRVARADLFPVLGINAGVLTNGSGSGSGGSFNSSGTTGAVRSFNSGGGGSTTRTNFTVEGTLDWDLIARFESNAAAAQVSAADLANATLSAQVAVATDYFQLRGADALQHPRCDGRGLRALLADRRKSVSGRRRRPVRRHHGPGPTRIGTGPGDDVGVARAQFEHAVAVLPPSTLRG